MPPNPSRAELDSSALQSRQGEGPPAIEFADGEVSCFWLWRGGVRAGCVGG